jgi:hypothetical protein
VVAVVVDQEMVDLVTLEVQAEALDNWDLQIKAEVLETQVDILHQKETMAVTELLTKREVVVVVLVRLEA